MNASNSRHSIILRVLSGSAKWLISSRGVSLRNLITSMLDTTDSFCRMYEVTCFKSGSATTGSFLAFAVVVVVVEAASGVTFS